MTAVAVLRGLILKILELICTLSKIQSDRSLLVLGHKFCAETVYL